MGEQAQSEGERVDALGLRDLVDEGLDGELRIAGAD